MITRNADHVRCAVDTVFQALVYSSHDENRAVQSIRILPPHGINPGRLHIERGVLGVKVVLSSEEILRGLKHYRRIAKQDVLRAPETPSPDAFLVHAEARREVYGELAEMAEKVAPEDVVDRALDMYKTLPFLNGTAEDAHADYKGKENALENFFLMIGLDPKVRREARRERKPLE